jgi:hypothetical protein
VTTLSVDLQRSNAPSHAIPYSIVTSFFNEKGHQIIQRNGAWCEHCEGELILVWQPGDAS